ncbi:MAG: TatD family hydrolase [Gammaproteobacteria bacterium]|nr:TatD family hydrolase [Gammaproteobacteria bacterium]MDH5305156.1 TatD family hydrolase [Gammaproteobacteria bacterium]MDH5323236.1 TatD family hydrolase [Gammaproteobacteria bacterium]
MPLSLIDIGANLTHASFADDLADVLHRAEAAGVRRMVVTGSSDQGNIDAADLAADWPDRLYATAGVHPHHAADYTDASDELIRSLALRDAVVAIGECGLDYYRNYSPRAAQLEAFRSQLDIAADTGLPVFLHQRDAHDDFVAVLGADLGRISRAVAHCFTGEGESLREYLDMGLWIGITGWICDERRGTHLQDIVAEIPDDRLLIETDAPYLLPRTLLPKPASRRNEPAFLTEVLRVVASARGQSEQHVAEITCANAMRFFGIPAQAPTTADSHNR